MRQFWAISASLILFSSFFLGCDRAPKKDDGNAKNVVPLDPNVKVAPQIAPQVDPTDPPKKVGDPVVPVVADGGKQEKYEAALVNALVAMADHKWQDALTSFESARSLQDNEFVRGEIAKLKQRMDQDGAAKKTVKDIETVLNDGKADDAAKLAKDALKEFGDGDDADRLVELSLQAEALKSVENGEAKEARHARFRKEGDLALEENNLRAAALAFEQALLARDDADLQRTYDGIRVKLDTYDALRKKAIELRKDPLQIEDAIAALNEAKAAWDTLQIRQMIDEYELAKVRRRDTVSVADFELRGDIGAADAGMTIADELLPLLKPRYDLVERGQLKRIIGELKLERNFADDPKQQAQLGKVAKVRYLVVGSVSRLAGISVRARLVDVQTGLVVQTGKVLADSVEEAVKQLPELAQQLLMTDEEKLQADQQQQKAAQVVPVVPANAVVPPMPDKGAPPAPIMNGRAPALDNVQKDVFVRFQAAPADGVLPPPPPPPGGALGNRFLVASVQLGDFFFASGRFGDAQQQYMLALSFDPTNWDIRQRLTQVALQMPSGPVVVVQPFYVRPRIAVMPFYTLGNPLYMPPALTYWTPAGLAPYFSSRYEVVDANLVYWYMARVGLSMNDILTDPIARRWLGRATGVRYFVFGNHIQTASFDVNTYMVDAEFGYLRSSARINVQNTYELKVRLPELAKLTMMTPSEQEVYLIQQTPFGVAVENGFRHMREGRFDKAVIDFGLALAMRPDNVQVQLYLIQAQQGANQQSWQVARQQQWQAQQAAQEAARQRQLALALQAQRERERAVVFAAALTPAQRETRVNFRFAAKQQLFEQAQVAVQTKNVSISVNLFRGASGFTPPAGVAAPAQVPSQAAIDQALAQARQSARQAEQVRLAQFTAARERDLRTQREQQLQQAQQRIADEQKKHQDELNALRIAQNQRDEKLYGELRSQGIKLLTQNKFDAAVTAFQGAQRLKHTDEIRAMIADATQRQALARAKNDSEKKAIEEKLLAETTRHKEAEQKSKQKEAFYRAALQAAQQALAQKKFDEAQRNFLEAAKHFKTDEVTTGLQQVNAGKAALAQQAEIEKKKLAQQKQTEYLDALHAGQKALQAKNYPGAIKSAELALQIMPNDVPAGQLLQQAQKAQQAIDNSAKTQSGFKLALDAAQKAMAAKNYLAAIKSYNEALALNPTDANVRQQLKIAQQAQADAQGSANYQKAMTAGQNAMSLKRYADAVNAYKDALKWMPNDKAATAGLQNAQQALTPPKTKTVDPPVKPKTAVDPPPANAYDTAMQKAAAAEKGQKFVDAVKYYADALKARPKDKDAQAGWNKSQYNVNMAQGQQYLNSMMWMPAQAEFESALRIFPGDPNATKLLQKAKNRMR